MMIDGKNLPKEVEVEKEECNHEYLPDGGKYSPQWQMKCIHCGKVIND